MKSVVGFFLILMACTACAGVETNSVPSSLLLERLIVESGERIRIKIPPDENAGPVEPNPQAYIEFVITDVSGKPVRATVWVDGQIMHRDVNQFLLVMPDPSRQALIKVTAPGYQSWELGFRLNLKHSRRFQLPIVLQPLVF